MSLCGELWPDAPAPDGTPVTCHLDAGHGGLWHRWDHENHVAPGEDFGDGMIAWHTELALILTAGKELTPTVVKVDERKRLVGPIGFVTHDVEPHPMHVTLRNNLPEKPAR